MLKITHELFQIYALVKNLKVEALEVQDQVRQKNFHEIQIDIMLRV